MPVKQIAFTSVDDARAAIQRRASPVSDSAVIPKYSHPKILLIDINSHAEELLKSKGHNVSSESFGQPYKVTRSEKLNAINVRNLSNHAEQEIVIVDLEGPDPVERDKITGVELGDGAMGLFGSCMSGIIDSRPICMLNSSTDLERILQHKGVLIAFASPKNVHEYIIGQVYPGGVSIKSTLSASNWEWPKLKDIAVSILRGEQIETNINTNSPFGRFLAEYLKDSTFTCTLSGFDASAILAKNKFGNAVAAVFNTEAGGWVFIFPRVKNQAEFICTLVSEILPTLVPHVYPEATKYSWTNKPPYELPKISELNSNIAAIKSKAEQEIAQKESEIKDVLKKHKYLYDLLTQSGDELVDAVKHTLQVLGFPEVVDVDQHMQATQQQGMKREDLWIKDRSPILLIEVKGVGGYPSEDEVMQIHKYVAPRMRQWSSTDVQGLGLYNHQRHLPPLDREHKNTFTADSLTNARDYHFGLMTTWDLHRLTRSYIKNNWNHENVASVFYGVGRIEPIPSHYEFIGVIERYYPKHSALSIELDTKPGIFIKIGDRIAFELAVEFEEQLIESLRLDNKDSSEAHSGQVPGITTHLTKDVAKAGVRVFKIKAST